MLGYTVWLDVNMLDKSEAAMREGVCGSKCVLALVTDDGPAGAAYFARPFCLLELRCAVENEVFIQPVVSVLNKIRINELMSAAPDDLRGLLLSIDFKVFLSQDALKPN